jgi:type III pantothenate kinase
MAKMLLAAGIGNSNITFGIHDEDQWIVHKRIRTVPNKTSDEYLVLFRDLLSQGDFDIKSIQYSIFCSVVPPLTSTFQNMIAELTDRAPLVVEPGIRTGIRIRTDNPVEVGSDLVANAVAAYEKYHGSSLVVDFGTALTFTAVAEPGDLLGVAIAPGLVSAIRVLAEDTAQLPSVQLIPPPNAIGRNTIHSIQSGIIFGYVGMIEAILRRMKKEMPSGNVEIIATGGQAKIIAPLTAQFTRVDPLLTLDGLRIISERNR